MVENLRLRLSYIHSQQDENETGTLITVRLWGPSEFTSCHVVLCDHACLRCWYRWSATSFYGILPNSASLPDTVKRHDHKTIVNTQHSDEYMATRGPDPIVSDEELMRQIKQAPNPFVTPSTLSERVDLSRQRVSQRLARLHKEEAQLAKEKMSGIVLYWLESESF